MPKNAPYIREQAGINGLPDSLTIELREGRLSDAS